MGLGPGKETTMKVVIVGPPHSGKSVFLGGLMKCMPREKYYLFRACPDGEGTWTWRNEEASKFRRKGNFSREIVDWYVRCLAGNRMAPIVLVDVGGRITEENRRILCEGKVDAAIILAGDLQAVPEWETFLQDCGVRVLARIYSDYEGQDDDVTKEMLSVHHLERGEDVSSRPVIKKIAAMLLDMVDDQETSSNEKENTMKIYVSTLAEKVGKKMVEKTLPNGRVIKTIEWRGTDLKDVWSVLKEVGHSKEVVVDVDGGAPAWLVSSIVHSVHPSPCRVNSPDGFVPIGCEIGENPDIEVSVNEKEKGMVVMTIQAADPSKPFSREDLGRMPLPDLFGTKVVVISGRMPNWMAASVADHYAHKVGAVAHFQPGVGATVAISHTQDVVMGTVIKI